MVTIIGTGKRWLANTYNQHKKVSWLLGLSVIALLIYSHPQGFLNLWLTRDQQAMIAFQQGNTAKAAQVFENKQWVAASYYADANFEQAASTYATLDGVEAKFAQANALSHGGLYLQAAKLYETVLNTNPTDQRAVQNLSIVNAQIEKMKQSKNKKKVSTEIDKNPKVTAAKKKSEAKTEQLSNAMWLQQVQQNPSKFLQKKFQQEYNNENK